jgi:pimeloyl-ACP methyl ester carboxylesterase
VRTRLITALAVAALLLTGCVQEVKPLKLETLQDFQSQQIKWRTCYDQFKCADVLVPIDYTNIKLGTFKIAVLKYEASNKEDRIGSMFVNPGGPGASGFDYAYQAEYIVSPQVLALYDIVGFDPRGVGRSAPIRCLTDDEMDANYASDAKPDSPAELETLVQDAQDYVAKCEKNTKNLTAYSTENAVRDMDVIRAVLGDKKLNYLGKSYGTYLGTIYAQLFPDKVGRIVLDGAIDPDATPVQQSITQAVGFDNALDAFVKDCLQLDSCPLPKDATKQYFTDLFDSVAKKPLTTSTKRVATESLVVLGTASALYDNESGWPMLRAAIKQAQNGRGFMFLSLADAYTGRQLNGTYPSNEGDSGFVIDCLDWNDGRSNEQIAQDAQTFKAQAPVFGPYLSYSGISCKYFTDIKQPIKIKQIKTTPMIVIGTLRDPATPYSWAVALNKLITDSRLITLDGDGHTGHGRGSACVDKTVDEYFITGKIPATDQKCDLSTAL